MRVNRQKGFILIAMSVCMFLLLAVVGMAFDLGRVYIARNEAQVFTDAASMAAAAQLDGTAAGLDRARAAVAALPGHWYPDPNPEDLAGLRFARVTAPDNRVEIAFLRAVGGPENITVPARAVAST